MLRKKPKHATEDIRPATHRWVAFLGGGFVLAGLVGLFVAGWLYIHRPVPADQLMVNVADAPSSEKPSRKAVDNYSVASDVPKYINMPAIGVSKTRVETLGLKDSQQIATPNNIYDAGWYKDSAKPGQKGAIFVYGHVSSWTANGAFHDLKKLHPGDQVTVTRGDNKNFTYQVVRSKTYPHNKVDMDAVLSPADPHKPGLNLMTCTGHIIKDTSEFDERLVVFTSLVKS